VDNLPDILAMIFLLLLGAAVGAAVALAVRGCC
jgi:hypothetical protein